MKSIRWIKVKLQETIKRNISNKSKNNLGIDRVEQFISQEAALSALLQILRNTDVEVLKYAHMVTSTPKAVDTASVAGAHISTLASEWAI